MTEQLPAPGNQGERRERESMPEVKQYPDLFDQQLVDAILADPLTPAAEHLLRLSNTNYKSKSTAASAAYKRLRKPVVREYLRIQQERIRIAADLEKEDLLQQLVGVINSDITQVAGWNDKGKVEFRASEELPTHTRRAIKKLKTRTTTRFFESGGSEETVTTELEMYSRHEAIELFAKVAGILKGEGGNVNIQNGVILLPSTREEQDVLKGKEIYEG